METAFKYKLRKDDPLYSELHYEVMNYFKRKGISHKGDSAIWFKVVGILVSVGLLYYVVFFTQQPVGIRLALAVLLGMSTTACGFNISHEALHNNISRRQQVNRLLGYTMDLLGSSGYLWKINHGAHHSYTNVHGLDGDIKDSAILRLCPYAPYRPMHRFQLFTAFIIYANFYLLIVYVFNTMNILGRNFNNNSRRKHPKEQVLEFVFFKMLYLVIWVVLPLALGSLTVSQYLMSYLIMSAVMGLAFATVFFLAHTVLETHYTKAPSVTATSWAAHQLETTCNFRTGRILGFFLGGLQYQVEHHLFPQICSNHFRHIAPIVQRIAARHGVPYHSLPGTAAALRSHVGLLGRLSRETNVATMTHPTILRPGG